MSDLVERLTELCGHPGRFGYSPDLQLVADARDEITRLRAENERLTGEIVDSRARETALRSACDSYAKEAQKFHDEARAAEAERDTATRALTALRAFHHAWVEHEVATATGDPDFAREKRAALIAAHHTALSKTEKKGDN